VIVRQVVRALTGKAVGKALKGVNSRGRRKGTKVGGGKNKDFAKWDTKRGAKEVP
jgi:hypothetical protein